MEQQEQPKLRKNSLSYKAIQNKLKRTTNTLQNKSKLIKNIQNYLTMQSAQRQWANHDYVQKLTK